MNRININKNDEITLITEKVIDAPADEIILSVPRFSKLAESPTNFHLLKHEAEALGKQIVIESVDDKVIELCKSVGLEGVNPFFRDRQKRFSDIVTKRGKKSPLPTAHDEDSDVDSPVDYPPGPDKQPFFKRITLARSGRVRAKRRMVSQEPEITEAKQPKKTSSPKKFAFFAILIVFVSASLFLGLRVLPRADIKITAARTNWSYKDQVVLDTALSSPNSRDSRIPGQVFSQRKNIQLFFPASGKKKIEQKARGKIIIYNAHSGEPQILVATTRFKTPDSKIFRIPERITVPGAKITGGKIQPSSIETEVIADKAGESYNIPPVRKFTIPGFTGTKRFNTFYAESKQPMTGGFIGETAYPSEDDIRQAKAETRAKLKDAIRTFILTQLPSEFKLLDGTTKFEILKEELRTEPGGDDKFSVLAEAEMSVTVFREKDLYGMLAQRISQEVGADFEVKDSELDYSPPKINSQREMTFEIKYSGVLVKKVDVEALRERIAGRAEPDLKAMIFSVAGLESAQISLWPFWVRSVPDDPAKISITID